MVISHCTLYRKLGHKAIFVILKGFELRWGEGLGFPVDDLTNEVFSLTIFVWRYATQDYAQSASLAIVVSW